MKGTMISKCEKSFIAESIRTEKRLDSRTLNEFRNLEIDFGTDFGCCYVSLGETKVLAQVTCELEEPSTTRPNEGHLYISVEFGAMASAAGEVGRQNQLIVHVNRFLEKCFKESRCVDLEALCIISEEQVWTIRVTVIVLNHDGNLLTCSSIATLAALAHFRTPAVTFEENEIIIHSISEMLPVPLSLHHFPVAISYAIFENGEILVTDPTEMEEKVSEAELVYGINSYRELCALDFTGQAVMNRSVVLLRVHEAAVYAGEIVKKIKEELGADNKKRAEEMGEGEGLVKCINSDRLLAASRDRNSLKFTENDLNIIFKPKPCTGDSDNESSDSVTCLSDMPPSKVAPSMFVGGDWTPKGGKSSWIKESASDSGESGSEDKERTNGEEDDDDDVQVVGTITDADRIIDNIELSGDSEEEEITTLTGVDIEKS